MAYLEQKGDEWTKVYITISNGSYVDAEGKRHRVKAPKVKYIPVGKTKQERELDAKLYARALEDRVKNGEPITAKTFREVYEEWRENAEHLDVVTFEGYESAMNRFVIPALGQRDIRKIRVNDIQQLMDEQKNRKKDNGEYVSRKTVISVITPVQTVFRYALNRGYIQNNPCKGIIYPPKKPKNINGAPPKNRSTKRMETWTPAEVRYFLRGLDFDFINPIKGHYRTIKSTGTKYWVDGYDEITRVSYMDRLFFHLAFNTGARRSELVALTFSDFDYESCEVTIDEAVGKTKSYGVITKGTKTTASTRTISVSGVVIEMVKEWERQLYKTAAEDPEWKGSSLTSFKEQPLFVQIHKHGARLYPDSVGKKFKSYQMKIEDALCRTEFEASRKDDFDFFPPLSTHGIRHTVITALKNASRFDPGIIKLRVGHEGDSVTEAVYTHRLKETDRQMAEYLEDLFCVYATDHSTIYGPTDEERRYPMIINAFEMAEAEARKLLEERKEQLKREAEAKGKANLRLARYHKILEDALKAGLQYRAVPDEQITAMTDEQFEQHFQIMVQQINAYAEQHGTASIRAPRK